MPVGEFVVGRSSSCHLALDDGLVSRRHAVFRVADDRVTVEDLGSRNGVSVNGETIAGARELKHLDRVMIGGQELLLIRTQGAGPRDRNDRPTLAGMTLDLPIAGADELAEEPTMAARSESVLNRIADKALALGRFDEAERMLSRRLKALAAEMAAEGEADPEQLAAATEYALKLAAGLRRSEWLDYVFTLHNGANALLTAEVITRIHDLIRKLRYQGGPAFKSYVASLRARAATLSPGDRFLLQRIESIERVLGG